MNSEPTAPPRRLTAGRTAVIAVVVGLAAMWFYVFVIATPYDDTLPDKSYAPAAEKVCTQVRTQLQAAGLVDAVAKTPQQRADLATRADDMLSEQIQQLRGIPLRDANSRDAVTKWLADWETWLQDRGRWVETLQTGKDAPFLETQDKTGAPQSKSLNEFAINNLMADCATPNGI